jgi:putative transposase
MAIETNIIDKLYETIEDPKELLGESGLIKELSKRLLEKALQAEMKDHLGYEKYKHAEEKSDKNSRNGWSSKKLTTTQGEIALEVPRDREGSFKPEIIKKGQRRFEGFDDKIIALYARGLTVRDIAAQLQELYGVEVSAGLISNVTDAVIEDAKQWQNRPLEKLYAIVYLDCLVVKGKEQQQVQNKAVYLALGITLEGKKEVLGMWAHQTEGAKFWLNVLTEIKNRGVKDILIACVDGLTGFSEAISSLYPQTQVQQCIVHQIRNSLKYVPHKERKAVAADLKTIYKASTADEAEMNLLTFAEKWDSKYPVISKSWQANWANLTPFYAYPPAIRKIIYTTNAIGTPGEAWLSKRVKFPSGEGLATQPGLSVAA